MALPMRALTPILLALALTMTAPEALTQNQMTQNPAGTNQPAIVCKTLNLPIGGLPADAQIRLTLTAYNLLSQCSSTLGAPLTLIAPQAGITLSPSPGSSQKIPFSVADDKGHAASANIIVTRN